jgi:hypothetical protein
MGHRTGPYRVLVGRSERDHFEELDVDVGIILK